MFNVEQIADSIAGTMNIMAHGPAAGRQRKSKAAEKAGRTARNTRRSLDQFFDCKASSHGVRREGLVVASWIVTMCAVFCASVGSILIVVGLFIRRIGRRQYL